MPAIGSDGRGIPCKAGHLGPTPGRARGQIGGPLPPSPAGRRRSRHLIGSGNRASGRLRHGPRRCFACSRPLNSCSSDGNSSVNTGPSNPGTAPHIGQSGAAGRACALPPPPQSARCAPGRPGALPSPWVTRARTADPAASPGYRGCESRGHRRTRGLVQRPRRETSGCSAPGPGEGPRLFRPAASPWEAESAGSGEAMASVSPGDRRSIVRYKVVVMWRVSVRRRFDARCLGRCSECNWRGRGTS